MNLFVGFHSLKDLLNEVTKGETVYLTNFTEPEYAYAPFTTAAPGLVVQHIHSDLELRYWRVRLGPTLPFTPSEEQQHRRLESALRLVREELEWNEIDVVRACVAMPNDFNYFVGQHADFMRYDEAGGLFVSVTGNEEARVR